MPSKEETMDKEDLTVEKPAVLSEEDKEKLYLVFNKELDSVFISTEVCYII